MSESYDVYLAKQFKQRENKDYQFQTIGVVESKTPLIVSIDQGQINLNKKHLFITESAYKLLDVIGSDGININDELLLLPSADGQKYFIIDKVRRVV